MNGTSASDLYPTIRRKSAWLLSWMGTLPWAYTEDPRSIMAILSGRHSHKFVKNVMVVLDMRAKHPAYWMAYYQNRKLEHGRPVWTGAGWKMKGSNAWLYGRRVADLRITADGTQETIEWTEPDYYANNPDTYQLEFRQSGARRKVVRNMSEYIGGEPYPRWE